MMRAIERERTENERVQINNSPTPKQQNLTQSTTARDNSIDFHHADMHVH
jgi:hypothetical protein